MHEKLRVGQTVYQPLGLSPRPCTRRGSRAYHTPRKERSTKLGAWDLEASPDNKQEGCVRGSRHFQTYGLGFAWMQDGIMPYEAFWSRPGLADAAARWGFSFNAANYTPLPQGLSLPSRARGSIAQNSKAIFYVPVWDSKSD